MSLCCEGLSKDREMIQVKEGEIVGIWPLFFIQRRNFLKKSDHDWRFDRKLLDFLHCFQ